MTFESIQYFKFQFIQFINYFTPSNPVFCITALVITVVYRKMHVFRRQFVILNYPQIWSYEQFMACRY